MICISCIGAYLILERTFYLIYLIFFSRWLLDLIHPGVLDIRGRSDFLADLTLARRGPALATLVRPRSEVLFLWSEDLFVRRRLRSDFSRFDPASPGDGPTLATLVRPRRRL
jgi:hypothetical protein